MATPFFDATITPTPTPTPLPYTTLFRSKTSVNNKGKDDEEKSMPLSSSSSFQERMLSQLNMQVLTEEEVTIATYLIRSEEYTSELQSRPHLVCSLLFERENTTSWRCRGR